MRFLGPRSISSFLKTALDVVYFGLFAMIVATILTVLCLLSVPTFAEEVVARINTGGTITQAQLVTLMPAFAVSLSGYLLIMRWTRQVFRTLAEGDVFHPDNTRRLRWIGFGLAGVELYSYASRALLESLFAMPVEPVYGMRAVTAWFSVLVVFVLAEVFKEGARLRAEANLTI
ncbi:MAG: DUF2975 domain-containing protein [Asticcacaulis sp.]